MAPGAAPIYSQFIVKRKARTPMPGLPFNHQPEKVFRKTREGNLTGLGY